MHKYLSDRMAVNDHVYFTTLSTRELDSLYDIDASPKILGK
jgi:hypothetical protein